MIRKVLIFAVIVCAVLAMAKPGAYDLEILRQYSQFAEFEKYFDVEKVKMSYPCDRRIFSIKKTSDIPPRKPYLYTIWADSKPENPLRKLSLIKFFLQFDGNFKSFSSDKYPFELCESIYAAIHKNLPFEKWLIREAQGEIASIEYEDKIFDQLSIFKKDEIFRSVGISGTYVGTLKFGGVMEGRYTNECGGGFSYTLFDTYEFWFSDNGDVLVSSFNLGEDEPFLDTVLDEGFSRIKHCKESRGKRIPFYCYYSVFSSEYCQDPFSKTDVPYRFPQFCDYLIVRHDGTIEYGPKNGKQ